MATGQSAKAWLTQPACHPGGPHPAGPATALALAGLRLL